MAVPGNAFYLMKKIYKNVLPEVHQSLRKWKKKAAQIPNQELKKQALASIDTKTFHCEGGAIYAILAEKAFTECIEFIVAYQTISDYLDNLCDRSTSLDPVDFRCLHESMLHALTPGEELKNYYRYRKEQNDGGYLHSLVETCQQILGKLEHYEKIAPSLLKLATYYCDLQVYKHVKQEERVPRLKSWFEENKHQLPEMTWYEFSACTGSTLGIFCLVAYAFHSEFTEQQVTKISNGLFPYVQGLHILLDYFIDQEEDKKGGDLNFCFYYPNEEVLTKRFQHFFEQANQHINEMPDGKFHRYINHGLLGLYLSDAKVKKQAQLRRSMQKILKCGGMTSLFFYVNGKLYRRSFSQNKGGVSEG